MQEQGIDEMKVDVLINSISVILERRIGNNEKFCEMVPRFLIEVIPAPAVSNLGALDQQSSA